MDARKGFYLISTCSKIVLLLSPYTSTLMLVAKGKWEEGKQLRAPQSEMCKLYHVPNLMRLNIIPACRKAVPKVQSHDKIVLVPRNYNNKLNSSFFCKTLSFYYSNMRR